VAVRDAAAAAGRRGRHVFDDFIVFHYPSLSAVLGEAARSLRGRLRDRVAGLRRPRLTA
jgi:hypothetical protein